MNHECEIYQYDYNGFKVILISNENTIEVSSTLGVRFGSINQTICSIDGNKIQHLDSGVAHFIEHRILDSGKGENKAFIRFTPNLRIYTNNHSTCFSFHCENANDLEFLEYLKLQLNLLNYIDVSPVGIQNDKDIIINELDYYNSKKVNKLCSFQKRLYAGTVLGEDILGNPDSISNISSKEIEWIFDNFYTLDNLMIVVCGKFDVKGAQIVITDWVSNRKENKRSFLLQREWIESKVEGMGGCMVNH